MKILIIMLSLIAGSAANAGTMVCQNKVSKELFALIEENSGADQPEAVAKFNKLFGYTTPIQVTTRESVISNSDSLGCYEHIKLEKVYNSNDYFHFNLVATFQQGKDGTRCANSKSIIQFEGTYYEPRNPGTPLECTYFVF